jgi:hypothetical protein
LILDQDVLVVVPDGYAVDGLNAGQRDVAAGGGDEARGFDGGCGFPNDRAANVECGHGAFS